MALQYVAKRFFSSFTRLGFLNALYVKQIPFSFVAVVPVQLRTFHLSASLSKELVRFNLADIGEGIKEVQIKEWYIKVGDRVSQFNNICEVQSDKATVTITSRYDGLVKKIYYDIDQTALVGKPLIDIEIDSPMEDDHSTANEVVLESEDNEAFEGGHKGAKVATTPSIRKLAKEHNINLGDVVATGPHGRILKEDIMEYINKKSKSEPSSKSSDKEEKISIKKPIVQPSTPQVIVNKEDRIVSLNSVQKTMFKTMTKSNQIPTFNYCDEIDVSKLTAMKNSINSKLPEVKVTFMPFFIKAASNALLQFPQLNAYLDESQEHLIYKADINIGFAVDTPDGLVVPKIHSVQQKSILEISQEMNQLIKKAKDGKLSIVELTNGTFSLSNIGNIGGTYTSPLILPPELVIGGIGKVQTLPRFNENGDVVPVQIMNISWSADHRAVDGATMARFSNLWKLYIEKPEMFMLHLK